MITRKTFIDKISVIILIISFKSPKVVSKPDPGFDEQRFFWLANPNPFPPVEGGIIPEDPLQPHSGFSQRILIFGMKAHGKSVLGNYLFGNSPIAWPYGNPGSYFETRGGKRNMTGLLGRSKLDLTMIRVVEMPAPDIQGSKYSFHKRNEIKAFFMDNEDFFHIFCWVKNASEPRYTRADANMLKIIQEVYGKGFYKNLVILMAGYNFSKEAQEQRESWDNFRNRKTTLLKSMFPERLHSQLPNIPITGLDPMCDIFDQQAYFSFLVERNSMSLAFNHFAKTAVIRMDRARKLMRKYKKERDDLQAHVEQIDKSNLDKKRFSAFRENFKKKETLINRLKENDISPAWREDIKSLT